MGEKEAGKVLYMDEYRENGNPNPRPPTPRPRRITDIGEYGRFQKAKVNHNIVEAMEFLIKPTLDEDKINQKNKSELAQKIEKLTTAFLVNKINGSTRVEWMAEPVYWSLIIAELKKRQVLK